MARKKGEKIKNDALMSLCSYLYYKKEVSQEDIAEKFGITKSYVSKLLSEAKKSRIVNIDVKIAPLEEEAGNLIAKYKLRHAVVVLVDDEDWKEKGFAEISTLKQILGEAAAMYLESAEGPLESGIRIAVSCGVSPLSTILPLEARKYNQLTIVPLTVESVPELAFQAPSTLVGLLQAKYPEGTKAYGPQIIPQMESKFPDMFESIKRKITDDIDETDFALVGIGSVNLRNKKQSFTRILIQADALSDDLKDAVGEINNRPYDKNGKDLFEGNHHLGKHIIAVSLDQLRNLSKNKEKCIMAVAGGERKIKAIRVALENGFINTLVTDDITAKRLLEEETH